MTRDDSGHLYVVGLGPGYPRYLTPEADAALTRADALYGYGPYLDRVPPRTGQSRHASDNREERARAAAALRHGPRGALIVAGIAVSLLLAGWLAFYFLLFLPRGAVG